MGEGLMAAIPAIQGVSEISGSVMDSAAIGSSGKMRQQAAEFNARMAQLQAKESLRQGREQSKEIKRAAAKVKGAQRAGYASQGVLVDSGSAADVVEETTELSTEDVMNVNNNAWRQAFGFDVESMNYRFGADYDRMRTRRDKAATILTGLNSASNYFTQAGSFYSEYGGEK